VACIPYTLLPSGAGWKLHARDFTWYFESRDKAISFALATARDFAEATGQATAVRMQDEDGGISELREFGGLSRHTDPFLRVLRAIGGH
jgi:hypothetical protein